MLIPTSSPVMPVMMTTSALDSRVSPAMRPHGGEATIDVSMYRCIDVTIYVESPAGTSSRFSWDNEVFSLSQERTSGGLYHAASAGAHTVRAETCDINGQQSGSNTDSRQSGAWSNRDHHRASAAHHSD